MFPTFERCHPNKKLYVNCMGALQMVFIYFNLFVSVLYISASQAHSQALHFLYGINMQRITKHIIFIAPFKLETSKEGLDYSK